MAEKIEIMTINGQYELAIFEFATCHCNRLWVFVVFVQPSLGLRLIGGFPVNRGKFSPPAAILDPLSLGPPFHPHNSPTAAHSCEIHVKSNKKTHKRISFLYLGTLVIDYRLLTRFPLRLSTLQCHWLGYWKNQWQFHYQWSSNDQSQAINFVQLSI